MQDIRNEFLPNDTDFLGDLSYIKITLEDTIAELILPFFFCQKKIINIYKNNKIENFIIFSTPFHIKLLSGESKYSSMKLLNLVLLIIISY